MSQRIAVAIGVASAPPLRQLDGVTHAAEQFGRWATAAGFDAVKVITDRTGPVDLDLLRDAFDEVLTTGAAIDHLVVFFAGHGVAPHTDDQQLLLTRWKSEDTEAITMSAFRRMLRYHEPARVTFIVDACRTKRDANEPLMGSGVVRRPQDAEMRDYEEDEFLATEFGTAAYMIGREKPQCLFSSVVLHVLAGQEADAIEESDGEPFVTSRGLYTAIPRVMTDAANLHKLRQKPRVKVGFVRDQRYAKLPLPFEPEALPRPKPVGEQAHKTPRALEAPDGPLASFETRDVVGRAFPSDFMRGPPSPAVAERAQLDLFELEEGLPVAVEMGAVSVSGARSAGPPAIGGTLLAPVGEQAWTADWKASFTPTSQSLLVPVEGNRWAGAALMPWHIASFIVTESHGPILIYRRDDRRSALDAAAEDVVSRFVRRLLSRRNASALTRTFNNIGDLEPISAVILAYLCDAAGRRDHIRALATAFAVAGLPVPYDIVLLADLPALKQGEVCYVDLPAVEGRVREAFKNLIGGETGPKLGVPVAGGFPWLRQGWALLESAPVAVDDMLLDLRSSLTRDPFTTLRGNAGHRLAELIQTRAL